MEIKKQRKRISKGLKMKRILKGGNLEDFKVWLDNVGSNIDKTGKKWADTIENVKNELLEKLDNATKELFKGINKKITEFEESDAYTKIDENEKQKTEYHKWKSFINTFYIYKCDNDKCEVKMYVDKLKEDTDDGETLTEEEAKKMASDLMRRINIKGRKNIIVPKCDDENDVDCQTQQVEQQELTLEQKVDKVIVDFDEIFESILFKVKIFFGEGKKSTKECSQPFKNMISLLKALPNIDNNLDALVKEDIKGLEGRYNTILRLLKGQCSGIGMGFICGTAASALGKDILALYDKLKKSSDNSTTTIDKPTLLGFIYDIVPIMITNLTGIKEFEEEIGLLKEIEKDEVIKPISKSPKGGKKSSGAVRKEILGKLMKIYRIPNDKKEYVRHKGHLITIKQFKEEAKEANHAKPRKPSAVKKVVLGKERCIYKVQGSKKEHIKYKGALIPVADYKKLMGAQ